MKKGYKHIFFDLDHTLWDYDKNTFETITEIYNLYNLSKLSISFDEFLTHFHEINNLLWDKFNHGLIDRYELRDNRFRLILQQLGVRESDIPNDIGETFLEIAPLKSSVVPFTHEVLEYLHPKYQLHIISNGFDDVQYKKLKASNIFHYFDKIITSDNSGYRKPQKEIFEFSMDVVGSSRSDSMFVGDNLDTDIQGAQNAQMDHIFYNPDKKDHTFQVTYEIQSLKEIMNIL